MRFRGKPAFSVREVDDQWPQAGSDNSNKHREAVPIVTLLTGFRGDITSGNATRLDCRGILVDPSHALITVNATVMPDKTR